VLKAVQDKIEAHHRQMVEQMKRFSASLKK